MQKNNHNVNKKEVFLDEEDFFAYEKESVRSIKPDTNLLKVILNDLDEKLVTNTDSNRNTNQRIKSTYFSTLFLSSNMNAYTRMLSGAVLASALVLVFTFSIKEKDAQSKDIATITSTTISNELIDTDILIADLESIETTEPEPLIDDSDILADLTNTNTYELQ